MIIKKELLDLARLKGIDNICYAEKDYLLELVLFLISRNIKDELIFKGGTALYKFYKFERFSEDLDFSEIKAINIDQLIQTVITDLSKFGVRGRILKKKESFNSVLITLRIEGPLYNGTPQTYSNIRVDINKKSFLELNPVYLRFSSLYTEIPSFAILVMQEKEILAEKVRAILTRNYARDLFDVYSLIDKGAEIDKELIMKKLDYYNITFKKKLLINAINKKQNIWENELKPLLKVIPIFRKVKKAVLSYF